MWGDRAITGIDHIGIFGFQDSVAAAVSVLFERAARCFARRSREKRDVGLRDCEAGRIDRRGERGFDQPPHQPFAEFLPLQAQCRLQAGLEKPLALRWVEPVPASHRGLEQITRDLATFQQRGVANRGNVSGNNSARSRR